MAHTHVFNDKGHGQYACVCGRLLQYNLANVKLPPKVVNEGNPNYDDAKPNNPCLPVDKVQRNKFYEQNKDSMVKDYRNMKLDDFFQKWGIASGTWHGIMLRWNIETNRVIAHINARESHQITSGDQSQISQTPHKYPILLEQFISTLPQDGKKLESTKLQGYKNLFCAIMDFIYS